MRAAVPGPAILLCAVLATLCLAATAPAYVNHDAAWYLYMVDRWRDGATLYRDVVDTNPPLIIWLSAPPVLMARLAGASAPALFKIYVFALAGWTLIMSVRIVGAAWPHRMFAVLSTIAFVTLPFVKQDFGQREHFAVLLVFPYVLMSAATLHRFAGWERWTTGIAGGLGFAIKPHFLLAWLAVEAAAFAYEGKARLRSTLPVASFAILVLYAAAVFALTPQYFGVAAQVREVYGGLNASFAALLRLREVQVWIAAAAVAAAIRWNRSDRLPMVIFGAATGFVLAALLQLKGWSYHLYPARAMLALFFVLAGVVLIERAPDLVRLLRGGARGLAVVFAAALVVSSLRYVLEARHPASADLVTPLIDSIEQQAPRGPIALLSTATFVYPAFPAVNYTDAMWSLRQNSLLFLTGLYAREDGPAGVPAVPHPASNMSGTERALFQELIEDLCSRPPRLLIVDADDVRTRSARRTFDVLTYLRQNARLASLLAQYRGVGRVGPFSLLSADNPGCR